MRVAGADPSPLRWLFPTFVVLVLLAAAGGFVLWVRQQDAARRLAENRADLAEARLVSAEASLTAISRVVAAATATAAAQNNEPELALRRALDLVFEAYKDPSDARLRALSDGPFSSDALGFERTEAEHLISGALHLGGSAPYQLDVLSTATGQSGDMQITTHEVWTYDEVDAQNRRVRCVREESEQTYDMRIVSSAWQIAEVTLSGAPHRTDC